MSPSELQITTDIMINTNVDIVYHTIYGRFFINLN